MAEDLNRREEGQDERAELVPGASGEPERSQSTELERRAPAALELPGVSAEPYLGRFRFALGALGGFAVAALIAAVVLLVGGRPSKPPPWSAWKPSGSPEERIQQIANHIGPTYRLPDGNQLVAVNAAPLAAQGLPLITVRDRRAIRQVDARNGVLYQLCGLGQKCSIDRGKPSNERGLLLRREALELALYTFRYVEQVDMVIVTLPPPPGEDPRLAMYFRRGDLEPSLERPLATTLPSPPPSLEALKQPAIAADLLRRTSPEVYALRVDPSGTRVVLDQSPPAPVKAKPKAQTRSTRTR